MAEGDLVTYLNVWRAWEASGRSKRWAVDNRVMHRTMLRAADIRSQVSGAEGRARGVWAWRRGRHMGLGSLGTLAAGQATWSGISVASAASTGTLLGMTLSRCPWLLQLEAHLRRLGIKQASVLEQASSFDHQEELDTGACLALGGWGVGWGWG